MLSKSCCCIPLRTGSIIWAFLGMLGAIVTLAFSGGHWFYIVDAIFYLIAYVALLAGALLFNEKAVLVNLVFTGVGISIGIVLGIVAITSVSLLMPEFQKDCDAVAQQAPGSKIDCDHLKAATIATIASMYFWGSAVNVYVWYCNFSFFFELRNGRN